MTLSIIATCDSRGQNSSYFVGLQEYEKNPYDENNNPDGIIQMGLAENQVHIRTYDSFGSLNNFFYIQYLIG